MDKRYAFTGLAVWGLLWLPLTADWLESSMLGYMLIQIPGLIAAGLLLGRSFRPPAGAAWEGYNRGGIPGLLLATFVIMYWMLPRAVDAAIENAWMDLFKFTSLPLLAGLPLGVSWHRLSWIAKGFVFSNLISKLFILGWLYLTVPVRLCNNFLVQQQNLLGKAFLLVGLTLVIYFAYQVLIGTSFQSETAGGEEENEADSSGRFARASSEIR